MSKKVIKKITPKTKVPELVDMLEAGVHFGHEKSKRNPKMEPVIFMQRNRVAIIDLEQTQKALQKASDVAYKIAKDGKEILFVGTKRQAQEIVRRHAKSVKMPYVTKRWLGGTLTNFSTILKSIEKLDELKDKKENFETSKLTKKEKAIISKEVERMEVVLEGLMTLRKMPAAIFVAGSHDEKIAVREANRVNIPVIGITDTNADPDLVRFSIPANDDAVRALDLVVQTITEAIAQGKGIKIEKKAVKTKK